MKPKYYTQRQRKLIGAKIQDRFRNNKDIVYMLVHTTKDLHKGVFNRRTVLTSSDWVYDRLTDKGYKFYSMIKRSQVSNKYTLKEIINVLFN